ncbi:MAG: glycosyltransferase family 39 protein, partial [Elusimicrobiaceae bacterium]|nr:glycosyltransferase family 39 protein [Elusimicrobiaceae bacterium]
MASDKKDTSPLLFSRWTENRFFWILTGLCALLYFAFLGARGLWDPGESRYGDLSREMLDTGNWLVPHLNYSLYFEKPPLGYWLNALAMRIFGINETGVRFTTALAGFAGVLGTFFWAEKVFSRRAALLSAGVLMSSAGYFAWSQIPELDMLFSFFLCAGLALFYLAFELKVRPRLLMHLGYLALAAACLVKGLAGWVFPFVIVLAYLTLTRQWRRWKEFYPVSGIPLSVLAAGWWFAAVDRREPDFFNFFFVGEHLQRFATTKHSRTGRLWYFIPVVLGMLFPWTAALVPAVKRLIKEGCFKLASPAAKPFIYLALWAGSIFTVFSISSSKRPPYMVPLLPPLAVFIGWWFDRVWSEKEGLSGWFAVPYALLAGLTAAALFAAPRLLPYFDPAGLPDVAVPAFALLAAAGLALYYARKGNTP